MEKALTKLIVLALVLGLVSSAFAWPPDYTDIVPLNPNSSDNVVITLSGEWDSSCIPNASAISVTGNDIYFDAIWDYPPDIICLGVISGWSLTRSVGPLSAGTYTVYARLLGYPFIPAIYTQVAQFTVSSSSHVDTVYYVDAVGGNDNNDGLSPESSFATIGKAVDTAKSGDRVIVAEGVYTGNGNRDINFYAKSISVSSTDPNDPNIVAATIINCQNNGSGFIFQSNESPNSIVSGLTIINASTSGINCHQYSSPTIDKCVIMNNYGFYGGGIRCSSFSNPVIRNCTISGNSAFNDGGGIYCSHSSNPTITNCVISDNSAGDYGGGIDIANSNPTISNCTIVGNSSVQRGGGVNVYHVANVDITNSIIGGNVGSSGSQIAILDASCSVSYSNVQYGQSDIYLNIRPGRGCDDCTLSWGIGNIDVDPCFANADANDYHLQSQAGRWDPNQNQWVIDANTSECIDAGNPGCPLGLEVIDSNNTRINMGAYGGTAEASKTPFDWTLLADLTNDGTVGGKDFSAVALDWLVTAERQNGDLDRNGVVDMRDIALLVGDWLEETIWY